ncbi:ran-binding proteins 9/10 homolog isoform X1 [Myripristis murdjan]|uniref:ran-binding proteins 9/10 homolog isoform X1 n=1 Tax=Myripristis murdjan TaxID=586833 RepID=UPI0011761016|nr:ran-binding proteins 9/10 homolog isoform X1 [Myripristis murdjan]
MKFYFNLKNTSVTKATRFILIHRVFRHFTSHQTTLEKLHALGLKPMLLIGYPKTSKVMMPQHAHLTTAAKTCLDNMEAVFKLMVEGWTRLNPDQPEDPSRLSLPQDPPNQPLKEEEIFVFEFVPCDTSPITHNQPTLQETADPPPPQQAASEQPPPQQAASEQPPPQQAASIQEPAHQVPAMQLPQQVTQPHKRTKRMEDCPHNQLETFPVRGILQTRNREGRKEHLYDWEPCTLCGKTWLPSWEPA